VKPVPHSLGFTILVRTACKNTSLLLNIQSFKKSEIILGLQNASKLTNSLETEEKVFKKSEEGPTVAPALRLLHFNHWV